jgi:hypothetical protein
MPGSVPHSPFIFMEWYVINYTRGQILVGFEMLVSFIMINIVFWDVAPCSLVEVYRLFGATELWLLLYSGGCLVRLLLDLKDVGNIFLQSGN